MQGRWLAVLLLTRVETCPRSAFNLYGRRVHLQSLNSDSACGRDCITCRDFRSNGPLGSSRLGSAFVEQRDFSSSFAPKNFLQTAFSAHCLEAPSHTPPCVAYATSEYRVSRRCCVATIASPSKSGVCCSRKVEALGGMRICSSFTCIHRSRSREMIDSERCYEWSDLNDGRSGWPTIKSCCLACSFMKEIEPWNAFDRYEGM
jgi:hypothetical protein